MSGSAGGYQHHLSLPGSELLSSFFRRTRLPPGARQPSQRSSRGSPCDCHEFRAEDVRDISLQGAIYHLR
jgi:hypothetical protein